MLHSVSLKESEELWQVEDKRRSGRPKKLSTVDKQYLRVTENRTKCSQEELCNVLQEAWRTIPEQYLEKLQERLSK